MHVISVVSPCYNEEENIENFYQQVKTVLAGFPKYRHEIIFIDNASKDKTVELLKNLARKDPNLKIIVNTRNFGHIRSPYYGMLQAQGDAVVTLASDLQDPPEMIRNFIKKWEAGYKIVMGVKTQSKESSAMFLVRKCYYHLINKLSDIELVKNATGFGLYDKKVIEILRKINDPYPYARGLVADIGFDIAKIEYTQPARRRGVTKNNFYTLYDMAMLGITNRSRIPLRVATMLGFFMSLMSGLTAIGYLIAKLTLWYRFPMGTAPLIIGLFLFSSVQLFFIGIIGEYIGSIHTQVLHRPLVIEKERINF